MNNMVHYHGILLASLEGFISEYEPEETRLVRKYFGRGDTILMAGLGEGWLAANMLDMGADVIALEANEAIARFVSANVEVEGQKFSVYPGALMPRPGEVIFNEVENWACSTLQAEPKHPFEDGRKVVQRQKVMGYGINTMIANNKVNALALDVEGGELELVNAISFENLMKLGKIMVEYHRQYIGDAGVTTIRKTLANNGFTRIELIETGTHRGDYEMFKRGA